MATVHFLNVVKVGVEVHEMPEHRRTALHLLVDTQDNKGQVAFNEVILMWAGDKDSLLNQLGMTLPEKSQ